MNAKIYTGNIQPNPKEYKIWVNDEGVIKTWDGTKWIELSGESGGTASKYTPRYFKIDWDKASEDWEYVLCVGDTVSTTIAASYKTILNAEGNVFYIITGYPFTSKENEYYAFSYIPLYINQKVLDEFGIQAKGGMQTFEDIIKIMPSIIFIFMGVEANLSMDGITEITEEEFYKID